jgi:two-component system, LytTR family, sensor kinase
MHWTATTETRYFGAHLAHRMNAILHSSTGGTPIDTARTDNDTAGTTPRVPWAKLWRVSLTLAIVLGASSVAFVYFGMMAGGRPLPLRTSALAGLPDWLLWACLAPPVFWLGLRWRIVRGARVRSLLVHVPASAAVVLFELFLFTAFNHAFYYNPWAPAPPLLYDAYVRNVLMTFHYGSLIYWAIVAAAHAYAFHCESQSRALQTARLRERNGELETQLARTQLDVLRSQLHPHFLFNAFNTVSGLIRDGRSRDATDMVAHLGQLFRLTLKTMDRGTIPLREELELVHAYVNIEQVRFQDHLDVRVETDGSILDVPVPAMLLQPLVENAIRHGLRGCETGRVSIRAMREYAGVRIEVEDSGGAPNHAGRDDLALHAAGGSGFHLGLANLRSRLQCLYGSDFELDLRIGDARGTVVSVRIPASAFHTPSVSAA